VSLFDVFTRSILLNIPVGEGPFGTQATSDERRLVVTNSYVNTISIIDIKRNAVVSTVEVGFLPGFLDILE
jgi:YVTN family beta-propeller protein